MRKKLSHRGITFYRLLFAFFVVTFLCAVIIISQYIHFLNMEESQLQQSYAQMSDTVFENMSSIINQFEEYGNIFLESQDISRYEPVLESSEIQMDSPEVRNLWNHFFQVYNSSMSGAGNVSYLYLKNSKVTWSLNSENPIVNINEITDILGLSKESWNRLLQAGEETLAAFEKTDSMSYGRLMLAKEIYPDVILITGIAEQNIEKTVCSTYLPPETELCFVTSNEQSISFQMSADASYSKASYSSTSFDDFGTDIPDASHKYIFTDSMGKGIIKAYTLIPNTFHAKKLHILIVSVFLALIIWILCGGGLSYLLSVKLYQPVEEMLTKLPKDLQTQKRFHEFHLVNHTLQSLSDKNLIYENQLKKQNAYLAYNLWLRVLHGTLPVTEEIFTILQNAGFPDQTSSYVITQIMIISMEDEETSEFGILDYVKEYCEASAIPCYFADDEGYLSGYLSFPDTNEETIYHWFNRLKQSAQEKFPVQISVAVSALHTVLAEIPNAYQEASMLTDYNILTDDYDAVSVRNYNSASLDTSLFPENKYLENIRKLSSCLQCGQFQDALLLLNQIFEILPAPTPDNILESTRELNYLIDTIMISLDGKEYPDYISQLAINRQSLRKRSLKETLQYLTEMLHTLQREYEDNSSPHQKIIQIRDYIQEHYDDCSLSAQSVAEYFHISIPWLSTSFKKEMGEGFLEYIHKYRISKAKELIASTDLSLKEIAEKTGYTNYLTMSRAFKRYTGVTPKWYRSNE